MPTVRALLAAAGDLPSDSARRDAEVLLGHCLGRTRTWLYAFPEFEVDVDSACAYRHLLERRRRSEPVAYLTGTREFWSLPLQVNCHTLIPRPETETLVAWALELPVPDTAAVLDLGAGSGAIALAVASERRLWRIQGVDVSESALEVARANSRLTRLTRVRFRYSNWFGSLAGECFHLLLANPPYLDITDPHLSRGDVRFEPRQALVAGKGGLEDIERLIAAAPGHLCPGGWLLLEHGWQQGSAVRDCLLAAGFNAVSTRRDLAGRERVSGGRWRAH